MILVLLFAVVTFKEFEASSREKAIELNNYIVSLMEEMIVNNLNLNHNMAVSLAYNKDVQKFLIQKNMGDKIETNNKIAGFFQNVVLIKEDIQAVSLWNNDMLVTYGSVKKSDIIKKFKPSDTPFYTPIVEVDENTFYYYYILPIYDTEYHQSFEKAGYLVLILKRDYFANIFKKLSFSSGMIHLLIDSDNNIVSSNYSGYNQINLDELHLESRVPSNYSTIDYDGNHYILYQKYLQEMGWKVITLIPTNELTRDLNTLKRYYYYIFSVFSIIILLISALIMYNIMKPIKSICEFTRNIGEKDIKKRLAIHTNNELADIVLSINDMLDQICNMTDRVMQTQEKLYTTEIYKKQAELNFLQSQINPHFLYNTLQCIKDIAEVSDVHEISKIVVSLANIYRYSITKSDYVTVQEELNCARNYFNIIDIRFESKFTLIMNIQDDIMNLKIAKMILQPLVENAVYHGLERKRGAGVVEIEGNIVENFLIIRIKDNGAGIPEEILNELRREFENNSQVMDTGEKRNIGLVNINRRLKNLYGNSCILQIDSILDINTTVTVKIPVNSALDKV